MENSYGNFIIQKLLYQTEGLHRIILLSEVKRLVPMIHKINIQRKWVSIIDQHDKSQPGTSSRIFTHKKEDEFKSNYTTSNNDCNNNLSYQQNTSVYQSVNISLDNSYSLNPQPQPILRYPNLMMTNNLLYYPIPSQTNNFTPYLYQPTNPQMNFQTNYMPIYQVNQNFTQPQPNQTGHPQKKQTHFISKK